MKGGKGMIRRWHYDPTDSQPSRPQKRMTPRADGLFEWYSNQKRFAARPGKRGFLLASLPNWYRAVPRKWTCLVPPAGQSVRAPRNGVREMRGTRHCEGADRCGV